MITFISGLILKIYTSLEKIVSDLADLFKNYPGARTEEITGL